ncbi:hypothetical protein L3Y34_002058 [Caenorhabditis briggsae]|uniref:Malectin domain-containing protein n=1 Tax=Caenorhabditis briggsae TaxID=6238 RepID=A0AAE9DDR7_CAEBR|nr:hypothetical protein L3Y34_002058 [Caenorhabditis briggsae]
MRCPLLLPLLLFVTSLIATTQKWNLRDRVVAAINCGGPEALGSYGITYAADYHDEGQASDVGVQYSFNNAENDDVEIYQTERWSKESFDYEVPVGDGEYVIILKFSEVYFQRVQEKVFNVRINSYTAVKNLDIYEAAGGRGYAHDIYIPLVIKDKKISVNGHKKDYKGKIVIEFAKGPHDNPKVNGFAVLRGKVEDLPPPPAPHVPEDDFPSDFDIEEGAPIPNDLEEEFNPQIIRGDEMDDEVFSATSKSENPFEKYLQESSDWVLPVIVMLIVFIPIAYILHLYTMNRQKEKRS